MKLKTGENKQKKVLIWGLDGTGKSIFASNYCKENKLKPVIVDVDDTNRTGDDVADIDLSNDIKAYNGMKITIKDFANDPDHDTIIIDGVSSLIELLVSKKKGLQKYGDRKDRFFSILQKLVNTGKNIIFVGQEDMKVIINEDHQSNKPIIRVNSIVNEKYYTYIDQSGQYLFKTQKYRA